MKRVLLVVALALAGCGGDSSDLSGSLSEIYQLGHDGVRARLYSTELAIEYTAKDGSVPVRVTLHGDAMTIRERDYDLVEMGGLGGRRGDGTEVPQLTEGTITLDTFEAREGGEISGDFEARFETGRDVLDLTGSFSTSLDVVGWPPSPADFPDPWVRMDAGDDGGDAGDGGDGGT